MSFAYGFGLPHYQPLSGGFSPASLFTGGVQGAWYDPSDSGPTGTGGVGTLFSDRAGTTPCATPGAGAVVPVGAMLDKRASGYSVFFDGTGDYLVAANSADLSLPGDFTIEFWINFASLAANPNIFTLGTSNSPNNGLLMYHLTASNRLFLYSNGGTILNGTAASAVTTGTWNHIAVVRSGSGSNNLQLYVNGALAGQTTNTVTLTGVAANGFVMGAAYSTAYSDFTNGYVSNLRIVKGTAVYTGNFTPPTSPLSPITGTSLLTCGTSWSGNPAITKNGDARVDGLNPFQASPVGNHAIAANDTTARPELSARVNLLTYSEDLTNSDWGKTNTTVTANVIANPLTGAVNADALFETVTNGAHAATQNVTTQAARYKYSVYLQANGRTRFAVAGASNLGGNLGAGVFFDLSTGQYVSGAAGGATPSITDAGNGWWLVSYEWTANASSGVLGIYLVDSGTNTSYAGDITKGIFIWGADLRPTNIGSQIPAYQRVADQYTYDSAGFPRRLVANGTSSIMTVSGSASAMKFLHSDVSSVCIAANVGNSTNPATIYTFFGSNSGTTAQIGIFFAYNDAGAQNNALRLLTTNGDGIVPNVIDVLQNNQLLPITPNVIFYNSDPANATTASRFTGYVNNGSALAGNTGTRTLSTSNSSRDVQLFADGSSTTLGLMDFFGLIIVNATITGGQRTATQNWIAAKMGVTLP